MSFFNLFLSLFFVINASATEVTVVTTNNRQIILEGSNCKELKKSEADILTWTEKVEGKKRSSGSCVCNDSICSLNVTEAVPLFAKEWHNIPSKTLSGNCWNTVLRVNEILPSTRMTYPEELRFILNSPIICKEKAISASNESGDMIVIRDNNLKLNENERELHAFIYINENLSFQKKGPGAGEPVEIVNSKYAYTFITNPICKKVDGNPPTDPEVAKRCSYYANVYSCSSIKDVMKKNQDQLSNSTKEQLKNIDQVENSLQTINNLPITQAEASLNSVIDSLLPIKNWGEDHLSKSQNETDKFFIEYILNRTQSSLEHIKEANDRISSSKDQFPDMNGEKLDKAVEQNEKIIADWYISWKKETDIYYLLLDFTNKYRRLPANNAESIDEKELFSKLEELKFFMKVQMMPERFEIYLHPDVYKEILKNKSR